MSSQLSISNKYFLTKENIYKKINKYNRFIDNKKNIQKPVVNTIEKEEKVDSIVSNYFFIDTDDDSMFWCWFIFDKTMQEYYIETQINKSAFTFKKNVKLNLITEIRKNKKKLKPLKIKINEIENNLVYENKMNLNTLLSILICKDENIVYVDDKLFYECINNPENKTIYIYKKNDTYGVSIKNIDVAQLKNKRITVENINKPLKAISNYKVIELRELCKKFNINVMKTPTKYKTKKDLYLLLQELF